MVRLAVDLSFLGPLRAAGSAGALDPVAFAHRADLAGADTLVAALDAKGDAGFPASEVGRIQGIVRGRFAAAVRGLEGLGAALALEPAEVLLLGEAGGPVDLRLADAGSGAVASAIRKVQEAGVVPVVAVWPDPAAVIAAQDAGAEIVELDASAFAAARTDDALVDAHRRLSEAARTASGIGLRVRAGGGCPSAGQLARLAEVPEVEEVRVGRGLLARAVYDGVDAAVRAAREELDRGARRGERSEETT